MTCDCTFFQEFFLKMFRCQFCVFTYESKTGLNKHLKKSHPNEHRKIYSKFVCIINNCQNGFCGIVQYLKHLKSSHPNNDLKYEQHKFYTTKDFTEWKCKTESLSRSKFIVDSKSKNKETYICNRNGVFNSKGKGMREMKTQHSRKTTKSCPASIIVSLEQGVYSVQYYAAHIGHTNDLKHLDLNIAEKNMIAEELQKANFDKDLILSKFTTLNDDEVPKRINNLDKKELNNVMRKYKLYDYDHSYVLSKNHNIATKIKSWKIEKDSSNSWSIQTKEATFLVNQMDFPCHRGKKCMPVCSRCKICRHLFSCSCSVYRQQNTICKHIHFLCLNKVILFKSMENQVVQEDYQEQSEQQTVEKNYHLPDFNDEDNDDDNLQLEIWKEIYSKLDEIWKEGDISKSLEVLDFLKKFSTDDINNERLLKT